MEIYVSIFPQKYIFFLDFCWLVYTALVVFLCRYIFGQLKIPDLSMNCLENILWFLNGLK